MPAQLGSCHGQTGMKNTDNPGAPAPASTRLAFYIFGTLLGLSGLALAVGGVRLATLGGSWYYLLAGLGMLLAGVLYARRKPLGAGLMALGGFVTATDRRFRKPEDKR